MAPPDSIPVELQEPGAPLVGRRSDGCRSDGSRSGHYDRDGVAIIVRRLWEEHLELPANDLDLFEGLNRGADHGVLAASRLERMFAAIEQETGAKLPITTVFRATTCEALIDCVRSGGAAPFRRPLLIRPGESARRPLFVLPGLGGLGLDVVELCRAIPNPGPVFLCHPRGMDGSHPLLHDMAEIVRDHIEVIRTVQPHGPYQFLGYSYGGLVAIEMARSLVADGENVDFLGVLEPGLAEADWPYRVWLEYMGRRLAHHARELRRLTPTEALAYAGQRLTPLLGRTVRLLGYNLPWWSPLEQIGLAPFVQSIWDAELDSARDYRMKFFDGKVSLFASMDGDSALCDPRKLWPRYVREVEVNWVPGNHMTFLRPPSVQSLARDVAARLPAKSGRSNS